MSTIPTDDCFIFVIKTDSYAGNFEREMCGYITGEVGECEMGAKEAAQFKSDYPENYEFEDLVLRFPDDHGCYRPATMWSHKCSDVAIFLEERPTEAQLAFMRDRARKFAVITNPRDGKHKVITIFGFELRDYRVTHTDTGVVAWEGDG